MTRMICVAAFAGACGCWGVSWAEEAGGDARTLQDISGVETLREAFNGDMGRTRIVALLSPTCGVCIDGAGWIQAQVLEGYPDADLRVYAVWLPMLATDRRDSWDQGLIDDDRAFHYWDGGRAVGRWFAREVKTCEPLGPVAWDAYYLFGPEAEWKDVPEPVAGCGAPIVRATEQFREALRAVLETSDEKAEAMRIEVLYMANCPHYEEAAAVVREVALASGVSAVPEMVEVKTADDARRLGFLGSPTIRVNGLDIDPKARGREQHHVACRLYDGAGVPSRGLVAEAFREAGAGGVR